MTCFYQKNIPIGDPIISSVESDPHSEFYSKVKKSE